ncbi:hypothetical protein [Sulfobacillus sp. hq2]|uniref:hypothetical protein n=1 Tax=Sulfobacillus TaxID=28033 RepID=UPI000CD1FC7E|nr:hypothetical protein [Sulfobacillus sp. hq2]POB12315.1 hypothetical protein CO251_00160 [Sulfobacillus sp. hq2]
MSSSPSSLASQALPIAALAVGVLGLLAGGFALGVLSRSPAPTASAPKVVTRNPSRSSPPPAQGLAAVLHTTHLWAFPVDTLHGHTTTLAHGSHGTVVLVMASWCLYCGYEDRYVIPHLVNTLPQVTFDIVDVSPEGGIADPGPLNPPFSGHDGTGGALTTQGMEQVMTRYVHQYHVPPSVHVYVAPPATQEAWRVSDFPTWVFANKAGVMTKLIPGATAVSGSRRGVEQAIQ